MVCQESGGGGLFFVYVPSLSMVGSLTGWSVKGNDIAYSVTVMSWCMEDPNKEHWLVSKMIFWYMKDTSDMCLIYVGAHDCGWVVILWFHVCVCHRSMRD